MLKRAILAIIGLSLGSLAVYQFLHPSTPVWSIDDSSPLAWIPPEQFEDSSPLMDLTGFKIYCWNSANQEVFEIQVDDPQVSSFEVTNFEPGTYQCAIRAVSETGGESALSNVVTRTVPR